jgi:hypothetical protein
MTRSQTNALLGRVIQDQVLLAELIAQQSSLSIELAQQVSELTGMISPGTKVDEVAYGEIRTKLKAIADRLQGIAQTTITSN